jgi:hypothetical protein
MAAIAVIDHFCNKLVSSSCKESPPVPCTVLKCLPACAPGLNPVNYIWGYMKQREPANPCLHTIGEAGAFARNRLKSMQRRAQLITAFRKQKAR